MVDDEALGPTSQTSVHEEDNNTFQNIHYYHYIQP
jgi:hypothetical protein